MNTSNSKRFAFYVSGRASRLIKVIGLYSEIIDNTFVVVNDEAPNETLRVLLQEKGVAYLEFNYKEQGISRLNRNSYVSDVLLKKLQEHAIDYVFCFGGKILNGRLLHVYKNKIINFHPALLPAFPGTKAIDRALDSSAILLGNTAHFIDEGMDTGPIIMQSIIHRSKFTGYADVLDLQLPMIQQIFTWINQNRIMVKSNRVSIHETHYPNASYFPPLES